VDEVEDTEGVTEDRRYARSLGERLRSVRQQQGMSLHDVEERSRGRLKASVVGAYERGERSVSITRLEVLADFYRVPVAELLPDPETERREQRAGDVAAPEVMIDLVALDERREDEPILARYVDAIKARRGDYNGRVLTVRASDLETLAAVLDAEPDELHRRLTGVGIVR
jgi:transcriptional regulator with XRE-family HTH domain